MNLFERPQRLFAPDDHESTAVCRTLLDGVRHCEYSAALLRVAQPGSTRCSGWLSGLEMQRASAPRHSRGRAR